MKPMKPSGGCFRAQNVKNSDEKHSVQSRRLVMMGWEDMASMDQNPPRNCPSLSTGMKPSGGCFRAPVLKDRRIFGRKGTLIGHIFPSRDDKHPRLQTMFLIAVLYILPPSECSNSSSYSANFPCKIEPLKEGVKIA